MNIEPWIHGAVPIVLRLALHALGALVAWVVGRRLIAWLVRVVNRILARHELDPTLAHYVGTIVGIALNVLLVVGILGYFGVETTSFAALVASIGVAIGAAWGGLLTNFAGGACILILHPFNGVDVRDAIGRLTAGLAALPNVAREPAPVVEILDFTPLGPQLAVRPSCDPDHYWQVYFDTNRLIQDTFGAAGYPVPEQHVVWR